jgi:hypothetical protein
MTKDEAFLMAIEALDNADYHRADEAITAIKAALKAKDEPLTENGMYRLGYHNGYGFGEAYGKANAPQRTWVHLTNQEHDEIAIECGCLSADWVFYGAAVERKVREKNS